MKAPIIILAGAESDIQRIYNRLTDYRDGAGDEFMDRLGGVFRQLEAFPESSPLRMLGFRRARPCSRGLLSNRTSWHHGSRGRGFTPGPIVVGADTERTAGVACDDPRG